MAVTRGRIALADRTRLTGRLMLIEGARRKIRWAPANFQDYRSDAPLFLSRQEISMQQISYRVAAFIATVAVVVMASGVAEAGSRGQNAPAGGQAGSNTTASKNQPKPKMTIKFSPEYTRMEKKSGGSLK